MSTVMAQFHFLQPDWLWALCALPLLLWLGLRGDATRNELSRLADPELLPHLLAGQPRHARWPGGLLVLGWTLGCLALAGPTWNKVALPVYADRPAQVIAISLSQHMNARDVPPSRIERARFKTHDLLKANADGLNGLIGYAGQSFVVAPLTSDAHSLDDLLDAMSPDTMPIDGDNAAQAIDQGMRMIQHARLEQGSLVLITDDADAAAQAAAAKALAAGVHVSVLGIGSPQGAPIQQADGGLLRDDQGKVVVAGRDDAHLRALADAGGGVFVPLSNDEGDIKTLQAQLRAPSKSNANPADSSDAWQDRGPWLLLPLLLIVAMAFRRGWLLLLPLVLLPAFTPAAHAGTWQDWWRRPDQQAAAALQKGQAQHAQQLAQDPALRGAAAYRAKDYQGAVDALEHAQGGDAKYNLGNALAKLGRYPDAIKAYDDALKLNPNNEDARANRKAVEDAMRQPPPKNQNNPNQQNKNDQQNKQGQQQGGGQQNKQDQQQGGGQQNKQDQQQGGGQQNKQDQQQGGGQQNKQDQQQGGDQQNKQDQQQGSGQQNKPDQQQGQSGQSGQQSSKPDQQQGQQDQGSQQQQQSQNGQQQNGADGQKSQAQAASAQEQQQTAKAQQGLQQQMDQRLGKGKPTQEPPTHELGAVESDDPLSKLPQNVRRDLQRVPDDPGALLRRKFELEYRERMGAAPQDGDQQP